ncbi:AAA family ATPase [Symbioplanes lichenis]|uniref:AAA family ATPase n=1 Tax=Symbioplanes lichenis TaxID=1629072 RepID=UPI0027384C8D|nr:AAA family ATPase [Actinoplanes lichenis]
MLRLTSIEIEGFGPFAEKQTITFPSGPGVTVIYGENMRGKTSLLNAIRYAFFGTVLGRGSRAQWLHTITNRDLAGEGKYGFHVALTFNYDGHDYELVRECRPSVVVPSNDDDYMDSVMLRRGNTILGPAERKKALQLIFPDEVSRFFLFDGELLQEYEELLINESDSGRKISEAIERILGVPILKRGRAHLTQLSEDADKLAAREASKRQETQALGTALQQATEQKEAHQGELARLQKQLQELTNQKTEYEQVLQSMQKYSGLLQDRDEAEARLEQARKDEKNFQSDLQRVMSDSWRSILREPVRAARERAEGEVRSEFDNLLVALRAKAIAERRCEVCGQDVDGHTSTILQQALPHGAEAHAEWAPVTSTAMTRLSDLNRFRDTDNIGEIQQLWRRIQNLKLEQITLQDRISDLTTALADSDPDTVRRSRANYAEVIERMAVIKRAIDEEKKKIDETDHSIQRLTKRLEASGTSDLRAGQVRAKMLREAAEVFGGAVEAYKTKLRARVEDSASSFFLSMTTEKLDYVGLTINESYGLTIRHRDGKAEEARSAGAEHVVALALMGALQNNAPLRGPIVMDSPFGRLDENHTANVVSTLPKMAEQVVLMVYEAEVGIKRVRELLGADLVREYRLERKSARRTNVREVR